MCNCRNRLPILVVLVAIGLPVIMCFSRPGHSCEVKHNPDAVQATGRLESDYLSGGPAPLRLTAVYSDNFKRLYNYGHIAQTYVEPGLAFWRSALLVKKPLKNPLKLKRNCHAGQMQVFPDGKGDYDTYCTHGCASPQLCYNVPVPREYLDNCKLLNHGQKVNTTDGGYGAANTDYLVFVDYKRGGCGAVTMAYAIHCQSDTNTDRPEIGMINYCPDHTHFVEGNKEAIKFLTIHELAHALGFLWDRVPYMRHENNDPRTRRDPTWHHPIEGTYSDGYYKPSHATGGEVTRWWLTAEKWVPRTTRVLRTPNVLAAARAHFNCPSLEEVEFENNGGPGTRNSHFEKHLYFDEVMVGSVTGQETVSELTLGFFKDTGWYNVNRSMATPAKFGKGLGCDFATQSCFQYIQTKKGRNESAYPWCDKVQHYCPRDKKMCTLSKMTTQVPESFRYVTPSRTISRHEAQYYAGLDYLMDYCPYEKPCGQRRR